MDRMHRRLLELTNIGVLCYFLEDNTIIYANHSTTDIFEISQTPADIQGRPLNKLISLTKDHEQIKGKIEKEGEIHQFEYRFKTLGGAKKWVIFNAFLRIDPATGKKVIEALIKDITNQKKAEDSLKHSEKQYRDTLHSLGDYIHVIDKNYKIVLVNKAFRKWAKRLGFEKDMVGEGVFDVFPFLGSKVKEEYEKVFNEGKVVLTEEENEFDGKKVITETRKIPVYDENEVVKVVTVVRDITGRKEIENALADNEAKYRAVVDNQTELICCYDRKNVINFVNEAYCNYFNKSPDELIGSSFMPLIHKDDIKIVKDMISRLSPKNPLITIEHRIIAPDGEIRWHKWTNKVMTDNGKITQFQAVGKDITELKKAQEKLRKSLEERAAIVQSMSEHVVYQAPDHKVIWVNEAAGKSVNQSPKDLEGRYCYEIWHKRDKPCENCPVDKSIRTGKLEEAEISSYDGRHWRIKGYPFKDENGKIIGVYEVTQEITARKKAEQELIKSNEKLKQLVIRDILTGLYNHKYLAEIIELEFHRARRQANPLSLIMIDIDYFKSINDVYGHKFGDIILKQFAKQLKRLVRQYDIVVRFGGEEFIILSPGTDRETALTLAQRLLDAMTLYSFGDRKHIIKLRLSMSVASFPENTVAKGIDLIQMADYILDKVKESGGNKIYSSLDLLKAGKRVKSSPAGQDSRSMKNKLDKLKKRANQSLLEAVFAFAKTIDLKDHYTGEHVEKTVHYASKIAKAMRLPEDDVQHIKQAAMLHDLGKIGVSEKILQKKSKLDKKEFTEIKRHPQIGADIIRPIQVLHRLIPFILYHHERWDGKGYPNGLKGEEIPMGARIIALADVFQALTSDRPYRKALPPKKIIAEIKKGAGTQFDPKIVDAFVKILKKDKIF
jgi:diguanylate cyclase (GGDEF)-like protein/PAS domain S-box-containing protein